GTLPAALRSFPSACVGSAPCSLIQTNFSGASFSGEVKFSNCRLSTQNPEGHAYEPLGHPLLPIATVPYKPLPGKYALGQSNALLLFRTLSSTSSIISAYFVRTPFMASSSNRASLHCSKRNRSGSLNLGIVCPQFIALHYTQFSDRFSIVAGEQFYFRWFGSVRKLLGYLRHAVPSDGPKIFVHCFSCVKGQGNRVARFFGHTQLVSPRLAV